MSAQLLAAPVKPNPARRPTAPTFRPPAPGSWRYRTARRSKRALVGAMLFSAAFHLVVLFGFNRHTTKVRRAVADDAIPVLLVMPDLKDLEEPEPAPSDGEPPVDQGLSVPTLADVPSQVDLSMAFVQQIDYSTLVPQQDLSTAKTLAIPTIIHHGGKIGEGMGKIFDLKDLDRVPQPLVQIAPTVPPQVKQAGIPVAVLVEFVVDANGAVLHPQVVETTDYRMNESATQAVAKWKFRPGIKNGRRVNVRMQQPFNIKVGDSD